MGKTLRKKYEEVLDEIVKLEKIFFIEKPMEINVKGVLVESQGKGQNVEIQVSEIIILGASNHQNSLEVN